MALPPTWSIPEVNSTASGCWISWILKMRLIPSHLDPWYEPCKHCISFCSIFVWTHCALFRNPFPLNSITSIDEQNGSGRRLSCRFGGPAFGWWLGASVAGSSGLYRNLWIYEHPCYIIFPYGVASWRYKWASQPQPHNTVWYRYSLEGSVWRLQATHFIKNCVNQQKWRDMMIHVLHDGVTCSGKASIALQKTSFS